MYSRLNCHWQCQSVSLGTFPSSSLLSCLPLHPSSYYSNSFVIFPQLLFPLPPLAFAFSSALRLCFSALSSVSSCLSFLLIHIMNRNHTHIHTYIHTYTHNICRLRYARRLLVLYICHTHATSLWRHHEFRRQLIL